ncbi:MAG: hypothetical protein JOZ75_14560 [Candidatus Dormibacteraeota bacterium]|nr:hypothetical protein [Candidatus Dormibacteraeota bacterium]
MAHVEITEGELVVDVKGFDRVLALKSEIRVPMEHVVGAEAGQEDAGNWFHGIRAPGTNLPGIIIAGTFYWHGDCAFYDVHHAEKAVAITLRDEKYKRLVVEVDDPAATIAAINAAVPAA